MVERFGRFSILWKLHIVAQEKDYTRTIKLPKIVL